MSQLQQPLCPSLFFPSWVRTPALPSPQGISAPALSSSSIFGWHRPAAHRTRSQGGSRRPQGRTGAALEPECGWSHSLLSAFSFLTGPLLDTASFTTSVSLGSPLCTPMHAEQGLAPTPLPRTVGFILQAKCPPCWRLSHLRACLRELSSSSYQMSL